MYKKIGIYVASFCSIGFILFATAFVFAKDSDNNEQDGEFEVTSRDDKRTIHPETMQEVQQRIQHEVQQLKQTRDHEQEKVKEAKERLQQKLAEVKDQKKQQLAKQIANQFDHLNQTWTDHFTAILNHLDIVLQKIQTRADKAAFNGKDVTAATAAIQAAKTAIAAARTAVIAQAAKTYVVPDTSVTTGVTAPTTTSGQEKIMQNLRNEFKAAREQLRKDLFALRDGIVKNARVAVQGALQELVKIPGVNQEPSDDRDGSSANGTTSPNQ